MIKAPQWTVSVLHFLTAAAAISWAYASHKNDCFNVGPCIGDVRFWINFADIAFVTFLSAWAAVLVATGLYAWSSVGFLVRASAWIGAFLAPPAIFFTANWWFNRGIVSAVG